MWDSANLQKCPTPEFLILALCITVRADRQTLKHIPWDATEAMLMRNLEGKSCLGWESETCWGEIQVRLGPMLWWVGWDLTFNSQEILRFAMDAHVWWNTYVYGVFIRLAGYTNPTPHFCEMHSSQFDFCGGTKFLVGESQETELAAFYTIMDLPWSPITEIQRLCNNEFNGFLPKWMVGIRLFDDCFLLGFFPIFQGRFVFWLVLVGSVLFVTLFFFFLGGLFFEGVQRNGWSFRNETPPETGQAASSCLYKRL